MLRKLTILLFAVLVFGLAGQASAGFSISVGSDDFYLSVGNYDYYQYAQPYNYHSPRISFYDVMSDYGSWLWVQPFGQVWRPYVRSDWRPYVYGHWTYTSYGPTWVGYEPWAWAGYHYGNWIWNARYGWVWIPGYDWHPGRVVWSHGYNAIGWMPAPPSGYDYSRGYLDYVGSQNQFDYYDNDFDDYNGYYDPYADYGNRDLYYRPEYRNIVVNLWVFIDTNHYGYDNYSDYYLDSDYTHTLFDRRLVRISSRKLERPVLERIVKRPVQQVEVNVREVETNQKKIRIVTPVGEEENVRKNATRVVKNVIAPAFAEKQREFKGLRSQNAKEVDRVFKQENRQPRIQKVSADEVIHEAQVQQERVQIQRKNLVREKTDKVVRLDQDSKKEVKKDREQEKVNPPQKRFDFDSDSKKNQDQKEIREKKNREDQFQNVHKKQLEQQEPLQRDQVQREQVKREQLQRKQVQREEVQNEQLQREQLKREQAKGKQLQREQVKRERIQQDPVQVEEQRAEPKSQKHVQQDRNRNRNEADQEVAPKNKKQQKEEQLSTDEESQQEQPSDEKPKKQDSQKKEDNHQRSGRPRI